MKPSRDILVVDDEEVVAAGLARICESEGLSVDTAESGAAGLDLLAARAYRLVLCDIMMEGLDGFGFLAEAERRGRRAPVVMTTGYATVENAVRSLQCGAIDYLPKPFTVDEAVAVVRRGLSYDRLAAGSTALPAGVRPCPAEYHRLGHVSWAQVEPEGTVRIGVHDLFVRTLGGIRAVALSPPGAELAIGASCAVLASADGIAHRVLCPVSGRVLETHEAARTAPATIEQDPHAAGWLYRVLPSELEYDLRCLSGCEGDSP